jgi:hypothetical protein
MPSEMSAVERVFQVFTSCGTKAIVVQYAAANPRNVSLDIVFYGACVGGRLLWWWPVATPMRPELDQKWPDLNVLAGLSVPVRLSGLPLSTPPDAKRWPQGWS